MQLGRSEPVPSERSPYTISKLRCTIGFRNKAKRVVKELN
jgi:hypothetical protein